VTAAEFPVIVERAKYFVPTIGVAALCAQAGVVVALLAGAVIGQLSLSVSSNPHAELVLAIWCGLSATAGGAWWLNRTWRIHHERKVIVDARGVTYVAFAGKVRAIAWGDILRVDEAEPYGLEEGRSLIYTFAGGTLSVSELDYAGYREIRRLTRERVPGKTKLIIR
jgi:hypothetical protein